MVSDRRKAADAGTEFRVSIRFEVRGGFRHVVEAIAEAIAIVSIRFEVRGGFRRNNFAHSGCPSWFQSALRFAAVSDYTV